MFANVARTVASRWGLAPGGRAARVTHTLLVIAVTVVPPGVRGTCPGCPVSVGPRACRAGPTVGATPSGAVAAVTATHCCGSHASADPGTPTGASSVDRMPAISVAEADDGGPPSRCRCSLAPRDHAGEGPVQWPAGAAFAPLVTAALPAPVVIPVAAAVAPDAAVFAPSRPVRVLYGVWRN